MGHRKGSVEENFGNRIHAGPNVYAQCHPTYAAKWILGRCNILIEFEDGQDLEENAIRGRPWSLYEDSWDKWHVQNPLNVILVLLEGRRRLDP